MLDHHIGVDAAAHKPARGHAQKARLHGCHQIVDDGVGDLFMERAFVAVAPHIKFEALEFDAFLVGNEVDLETGEIRLAGQRAQTGEFRHLHVDVIVALRAGVGEALQRFAGSCGHDAGSGAKAELSLPGWPACGAGLSEAAPSRASSGLGLARNALPRALHRCLQQDGLAICCGAGGGMCG
ncbi:hypothetical protein GALL_439660 [mine drainage metagenome]|uniref:Uncharacterized protein n=1 Tax=mine drainage metagenome TaxID=410659 RepID=A0A1J5PSB3_9ZZZZ